MSLAARASVVERALLAGEDLYLGSQLNRGRRTGTASDVRITDRDLRLMTLLHDVNFLSTSQLLLLGWGCSHERAGQKRLKRLHETACSIAFARLEPPGARSGTSASAREDGASSPRGGSWAAAACIPRRRARAFATSSTISSSRG